MLQIIAAVKFPMGTPFRLAFGFAVAALVYFGVLFALMEAYPVCQPHSAVVYGVGFAVATLLGVIVGIRVSPLEL